MITRSVRFCLSNDLFEQDFFTFKMNISSIRNPIVDTDVVNDFTHTRQSVITFEDIILCNNSDDIWWVGWGWRVRFYYCAVIVPVSVESLLRKYSEVRFLRNFEKDCSRVGDFLMLV